MNSFNDEVCEYSYTTSVTENFNNICLDSCSLASSEVNRRRQNFFSLYICQNRCEDFYGSRGSLNQGSLDMIEACKLTCDYTNSHLKNFSLVECQNICPKSSTTNPDTRHKFDI
jgi:hypothetical protein